ncbi:hypothetical protein [Nocardia sp. NPDC057668]|uniref:hypothetical protein n=1 Tax=Nocardia sp. NPDC057668 TaxID=3346202 RepID=UPI003671EE13
MALQRWKRSALGTLYRLSYGERGVVYAAPNAAASPVNSTAFLEYEPRLPGELDRAALAELAAFPGTLARGERAELFARAAWPCGVVEQDGSGAIAGFLMPLAPRVFFLDAGGGDAPPVAARFQYLLDADGLVAARGIALTDRHRYELLTEVAETLKLLHRHRVSVGDLAPRNLLFALRPARRVYLTGCDTARSGALSVSPQTETPGWDVRSLGSGEESATPYSDAYKLGLLALRLLSGDPSTRDPARLPPYTPAAIVRLTRAALSAAPGMRPVPEEWISALTEALDPAVEAAQETVVLPRVQPRSPGKTPRGSAVRGGQPSTVAGTGGAQAFDPRAHGRDPRTPGRGSRSPAHDPHPRAHDPHPRAHDSRPPVLDPRSPAPDPHQPVRDPHPPAREPAAKWRIAVAAALAVIAALAVAVVVELRGEPDGAAAGITTGESVNAMPGPATTAPAPVDGEATGLAELRATVAADDEVVRRDLAERWVPQLSSKQNGMSAEGTTWGHADILREHRELRGRYPGARLLESGSWTTFGEADYWVTVAGVSFATSGGAIGWCAQQSIDADHCYAKLVSTTRPVDGSTRYQS